MDLSSRWIRLSGVVALAVIIVVSLMLPDKLQQLRTGNWAIEHFFAYFAVPSIIYLGWRRPFFRSGRSHGGRAAARNTAKFDPEPFGPSPVRAQRSCGSVVGGVAYRAHNPSMNW